MDDVGKTKANLAEEIEDLRHMVEDFRAGDKQLRLLSAITEQATDSVITTDLDYKITYANPSFQEMYGYSRDELLGQSPDILNITPDSDQIQKDIYETVSSGSVWQGEIENRRKDGSTFPCKLTIFPLKDEKGNVFAYAGTQRDITDRKRAEEKMKASQQRYRMLFNSDNDTVFVHRPGKDGRPGRFIDVNDFACESLGYTREELLQLSPLDIVSPEKVSQLPGLVERVLAEKQIVFETELVTKDGKVFPVEISSHLFSYENEPTIIGIARDITERKQAEAALRESEEIYRSLVENVDFGITIIDPNHNIVMANTTVCKWFNKSPDELVGKKCYRVFEKKDHPCSPCPGAEAMATGRPCEIETKGVRENGTRFVVKYRAFPYYGPNGEIVGFHEVLEDITERKQAEAKLTESENRFRELFRYMSSGVAVYEAADGGRDFVFKDFNQAGERIEKVKREDVVGRKVTEAFPGIGEFGFLEVLRRVWKTGNPEHFPISLYKDERISGWRENYVYKLPSGEIVAVYDDITERKQAGEQLEIAKQQAEAANMAKSQFLANMSHEIRTPMSVITGFANLLAMEELTGEQKTQAMLIQKAGKSLLRIIDDVLDFSRIEAGKLEVRTEEYPLKKLLNRVESMMQPLAAKKKLDFKLSCSKCLPAMIHTDEDRLVQCLVNLIGNAIKFTDKGNIHLKVFPEKRRNRPFVRFDVKDTGIGIPLDKHESIFSSFTQVDGSHTRKQGGTGLGLTITKELAALLGGDLSFTSEVGAGSVFSLAIPAEADAELSILPGGDQSEESVWQSQPVDNPTFRGRVLVAEDEEGSQILADRILTRLGLEVVIAANGKEAIEKALHESWDLIFMDIQMPVLNGYEAVRKLRQDGITTPIIALTAYAMPQDREKCLKIGCDGYISKPFEMKELQKTLSSHISIAGSQT